MKTTKPENFKKWLDELRHGNRRQGKDALRAVETVLGETVIFECCLGVACDISGLGHWESDEEMVTRAYVIDDFGAERNLLPQPVLDWLGIAPEDAHTFGQGRFNLRIAETEIPNRYDDEDRSWVSTAAEANDNGLTFAEIADLLEREYL